MESLSHTRERRGVLLLWGVGAIPARARRCGVTAPGTASPAPSTLHPGPGTPHPGPRTPHPAPCTPHPAPRQGLRNAASRARERPLMRAPGPLLAARLSLGASPALHSHLYELARGFRSAGRRDTGRHGVLCTLAGFVVVSQNHGIPE